MQFKFLTTVISAILIISIFIGGLTTYEMNSYVHEHTKEIVDITCTSEASRINDIFGDIEDAVLIMESYVLSLCSKLKNITNPDVQKTILQLAGEMFVNVASNTDGAVTYYLRLDPSISDGKTGIFYSKIIHFF